MTGSATSRRVGESPPAAVPAQQGPEGSFSRPERRRASARWPAGRPRLRQQRRLQGCPRTGAASSRSRAPRRTGMAAPAPAPSPPRCRSGARFGAGEPRVRGGGPPVRRAPCLCSAGRGWTRWRWRRGPRWLGDQGARPQLGSDAFSAASPGAAAAPQPSAGQRGTTGSIWQAVTGGEVTNQCEGGWGSGGALRFGAAGQSAPIPLICVKQMNKIRSRQLETMQREPLSRWGEVCWSCPRPRFPSVTAPLPALLRFILTSPRPASWRAMAESCSPHAPSCPPRHLTCFMELLFVQFVQPAEHISLSAQGGRLPSHTLSGTHKQSFFCSVFLVLAWRELQKINNFLNINWANNIF